MIDVFPHFSLLAQATQGATPGWVWFLVVVAVFATPILLGALLGRLLKLREYTTRITIVLFALVFGLAPFVSHAVRDDDPSLRARMGNAIRLGIDLAGGTNLVYQVDEAKASELGKEPTPELMDQMVGAISRRIDPAGTEQTTVRRVGQTRLEVIIPGADEETVQRMKSLITRLGSLEFAILANDRDHGESGTKVRGLIGRAKQLSPGTRELVDGTRVIASWREAQEGFDTTDPRLITRTVTRDGEPVTEVLVVVSPPETRVTGEYLTRAYPTSDQAGGPAVGFTFNETGGYRFQQLTSQHRPIAGEGRQPFQRQLAILLDGKIQSAPTIRETISRQGIISGQFSQAELQDLINVLNAGALDVPLDRNPVSEFSISPLLGADVREKGTTAILVAAIAVLAFMAVYYMFAGLVANMALALNLILVLGTMAFIDAAFTLPGLAGLVLTIGMAVDANVLIFERIREESNRGSSLRMAIHNGFGRAFSAIIDANVTTLITAVILYMIGTDQVRGFAVTLFIGILMSMFTALYFGRLVFDIAERKRWIKSLRMMSILGTTRWDFIGKRGIAAVASAVMILVGIGALATRGQDNLDIDFRGGTMVTFEFEQPEPRSEVRAALEQKFGSGITLEQLTLAGEDERSEIGRRYRLRTTMIDRAAPEDAEAAPTIRKLVNDAFEGTPHNLRRVTVQFDAVEPIAPADEAADVYDEFAGGHRVAMRFSDEISVATAQLNLAQAIGRLPTDYQNPQALFQISGPADAAVQTGELEAQRFSRMELKVLPNLPEADLQAALAGMQQTMADTPTFEEVTSFDSSVAAEMQQAAIMAILISMLAIVGYLWFRFQRITFGLAAIAAIVHDVLIVVGAVAIAGLLSGTFVGTALDFYDFKINLPMIAAFLTIVGYSLNDTIVVFDRIREVRGKNPALTVDMINLSLNQTLSRTILTSATTLMVVLILYWMGGEGIHGFAFCLVVGVLVGTYSTIYVASPVLLWLMNRRQPAAAATVAAKPPAQKAGAVG